MIIKPAKITLTWWGRMRALLTGKVYLPVSLMRAIADAMNEYDE